MADSVHGGLRGHRIPHVQVHPRGHTRTPRAQPPGGRRRRGGHRGEPGVGAAEDRRRGRAARVPRGGPGSRWRRGEQRGHVPGGDAQDGERGSDSGAVRRGAGPHGEQLLHLPRLGDQRSWRRAPRGDPGDHGRRGARALRHAPLGARGSRLRVLRRAPVGRVGATRRHRRCDCRGLPRVAAAAVQRQPGQRLCGGLSRCAPPLPRQSGVVAPQMAPAPARVAVEVCASDGAKGGHRLGIGDWSTTMKRRSPPPSYSGHRLGLVRECTTFNMMCKRCFVRRPAHPGVCTCSSGSPALPKSSGIEKIWDVWECLWGSWWSWGVQGGPLPRGCGDPPPRGIACTLDAARRVHVPPRRPRRLGWAL
ncbi:unnamed protein product [Prorocentrum cordatum]|uniref:Uncharacterized protein n=1 Tax=Prorocentrum cordatum TaxID=2364126 RepID=A0ABN9YGI7_9DINO|nr:unnamed protein product [Polarella glacialis]